MALDAIKAFEDLCALNEFKNPISDATLRQFERMIRDDECAEISSGFRNTRQQNLHDYLDKRVKKRQAKA